MSEAYQEGYNDGHNDGYDEGYDEGFSDGQQDGQWEATGVAVGVMKAIHKWLEERGALKWEDHPDGLDVSSLMEIIYEHEINLVDKARGKK